MKNKWKKLEKEDMIKFLEELSGNAELYVPIKKDDRWEFDKYSEETFGEFAPSIIDNSVKSLFFPERRTIATFDNRKKWDMTPVKRPDKKRIIMGLHPCDVSGILYLDEIFLNEDNPDTLYRAERDRTLLIGMSCQEMGKNCHCTDRNLSPDDSEGMDVIFSKAKDGYLFRALNSRGEELLDSKYIKDTEEKPERRKWESGKYEIASPDEFLDTFDDDIWYEISNICLTCGACTFACPTCSCFLITDEKFRNEGERVTVWDSCQFASYSRMSGGHNPRDEKADRVRNRTLDKFAYSFKRHGRISCVGCGRCVSVCPLNRSFPQLASIITGKIRENRENAEVVNEIS